MPRIPGSGTPRGEYLPHLRAWRLARGRWQTDLAVAAGVGVDHLRHVESGRFRASEALVARLAVALRVPVARLRDESPYRADVGA